MQITVKVEITTQQVVDLISCAFEGGSNYWCHSAIRVDGAVGSIYEPEFWDNGGQLIMAYDDPDADDEGDCTGSKTIGLPELEAGLAIMAEKYPSHFGDLMNDNTDADTGDCFLQCVILGDVVYG